MIGTYKTAKILSVTSRAVDIIRTVYYITGPWRDRNNFCCFICANYGPYTLFAIKRQFFYIYKIYQQISGAYPTGIKGAYLPPVKIKLKNW